MTPTFCEECEHCQMEGKNSHPKSWLCSKQKRLEGYGFLTQGIRGLPPYMNCAGINGGLCSMYEPKRTNQITINLEEK